jgi:hypothetical protein
MDKEKIKAVRALREKFAKMAHEQWSGWIHYMFGKCKPYEFSTLIIPAWAVDRWRRQAATPYADLSPEEQDSDRKEADKFIALLDACQGQEPDKAYKEALRNMCFCKRHICKKCGFVEEMSDRCENEQIRDKVFKNEPESQAPEVEHSKDCATSYSNLHDTRIECTCKPTEPASEFVEICQFVDMCRKLCHRAGTGNNLAGLVFEACDRLETSEKNLQIWRESCGLEAKRADAAEKAHKSIHACYDAYKVIAENKVVKMAEKIKQLQAQKDAILQQARIWAGEAKTQRHTVNEIGSVLGGMADWQPIVKVVGQLQADNARLTQEVKMMKNNRSDGSRGG